MAERLRSFDFTTQSAITPARSKGRRRYPWNDWFDGDIWKITQGPDFDAPPQMMERIIRTRASNKNHRAKVTLRHLASINSEPPAIVLQRTDIAGPGVLKKAEAAERRRARKAAAEQAAAETLAAAGISPSKVNGVKAVSKVPAKKPPTPRKRVPATV